MERGIMFMGTSANAGKTNFVRALCRWMSNKGHKVEPFKAISMGEYFERRDNLYLDYRMWFFSEAARCKLTNVNAPIQIKMKKGSYHLSENILINQNLFESPVEILAKDSPIFTGKLDSEIRRLVIDALDHLMNKNSFIIVEGSGSPIDLGDKDISNILVARKTNFPIVLVAGVSKGGGIGSLIGTIEKLPTDIRRNVIGFTFNDVISGKEILEKQASYINDKYSIPYLGGFPHLSIYDNVPEGKNSTLDTKEEEYECLSSTLEQFINLDLMLKKSELITS